MRRRSIEDYQVGWVCALPKELTAARMMLDEEHEEFDSHVAQDNNSYVLGRVRDHNVVIACLPAGLYGIRFGLLVGIGGGIPDLDRDVDIRLGDVVVSQPDGTHGGVIQYDMRKNLGGGHFECKGFLRPPPMLLLTALSSLQSRHQMYGNQISDAVSEVTKRLPRLAKAGYTYPGSDKDILYCSNIEADTHLPTCTQCENGVVHRELRSDPSPVVHYGNIVSGNELMRNVVERNRLRQVYGAKCIEMEAAGLMNDFPCIVIRGICDYADSHKNDAWQEYAAATAAAFAKELLSVIKPTEVTVVNHALTTHDFQRGMKLGRLLIPERTKRKAIFQDKTGTIPSAATSSDYLTALREAEICASLRSTSLDSANANTRKETPSSESVRSPSHANALHEYIGRLAPRTKRQFEDTDLRERLLQRVQRLNQFPKSSDSIGVSYLQRAEACLEHLHRLMEAILAVIEQDAQVSSLMLGAVRSAVEIGLKHQAYLGNILSALEMIADHLYLLRKYALYLLEESSDVQVVLIHACVDVLEICVEIWLTFYDPVTGKERFTDFRVERRSVWEPVGITVLKARRRFEGQTELIIRDVRAVRDDQDVEEMEQALRERRLAQNRRDREENEQRLEKRRRVILWLSNLEYSGRQEEILSERFELSGSWLLEHGDFKRWMNDSESSILWCHGTPGVGKTMLASIVCDHISQKFDADAETGIAHVFCSYRDVHKPEDFILSFLRQLVTRIPKLPTGVEDRYDELYRNGKHLRQTDLETDLEIPEIDSRTSNTNLFAYTLEKFRSTFLIFDALDEFPDREKWLLPYLVKLIRHYSGNNTHTIKLFITSRVQADIQRAFNKVPKIEIEASNVDADIRDYVKSELRNRVDSGVLELQDLTLVETISTSLAARARGMFLWVKYQIDYICDQMTDRQIQLALQSLPDSIYSHYDRVLEIIDKQSPNLRKIAKLSIQWLSCTTRSLHRLELAEALAVTPTSRSWTELDIVTNITRIIHACHNLVSKAADGTVSFVHFSVQEYFISDYLKEASNLALRSYFVDVEFVNRSIAESCMRYLSFRDIYFLTRPLVEERWQAHGAALDSVEYLFADRNHPSSFAAREIAASGALSFYAGTRFYEHARELYESGEDSAKLLEDTVSNMRVVRYVDGFDDNGRWNLSPEWNQARSPLELAAKAGIEWLVRRLLADDRSISQQVKNRAMILASRRGYHNIQAVLIGHGVHLGIASPIPGMVPTWRSSRSSRSPRKSFDSDSSSDSEDRVRYSRRGSPVWKPKDFVDV